MLFIIIIFNFMLGFAAVGKILNGLERICAWAGVEFSYKLIVCFDLQSKNTCSAIFSIFYYFDAFKSVWIFFLCSDR